MFPWSNTPAEVSRSDDARGLGEAEETVYAVGDIVYSGTDRGTVVHVSTVIAPLISVEWDSGKAKYGAIIYPMNAPYIRKALPWE